MYGIVNAIGNIDEELLRLELGMPRAGEFIANIADSWTSFWLWVIILGGIGALLYWWIGGWWFRKRAEWSGGQHVDSYQARIAYVYTTATVALPLTVLHVVQVLFFPSYLHAYADEGIIGGILAFLATILPFWALVVGYKGVRSSFAVSKVKGLFWFVILPGVFYLGGYLLAVIGSVLLALF